MSDRDKPKMLRGTSDKEAITDKFVRQQMEAMRRGVYVHVCVAGGREQTVAAGWGGC